MSTLIFPDGIRLARLEELPGPKESREEVWAQIERANITPGFVIKASHERRFRWYAEANVDAPSIWRVFHDLSRALLKTRGVLIWAYVDEEPQPIGEAAVTDILVALEPYAYQLQHDGFLQFGIVAQTEEALSEVFVAPTKHFKVWLNDVAAFRSVMTRNGLAETDRLEFIDQYPRTTTRLPADKAIDDTDEITLRLATKLSHDRRH